MRRITFLSLVCALCMSGCTGLDAGWKALRSGDYDEAQRHAIVALAEEPRNPEVYHLVASAALMKGQYDSALKSAEFARALDGGTSDSERLIREICVAKKAWGCVCESGQRTVESGGALDAADESFLREGYAALLAGGTGDGYGCYRALGDESLEGLDDVKALRAAALAAQGLTSEALAIEETVSDPEVSVLRASRRLFALSRTEEAAEKLRFYVALEGDKEARIAAAVDVCEDYRSWGLMAELLGVSVLPENEVRRAIALRRAFRGDEASELLKSHFERERDGAQVRREVSELLEAGYAESAADAYLTCSACAKNVDLAFDVADELAGYSQLSVALQILSGIGDSFETDEDVQLRLFKWYRTYKYYPQALLASERVVKQEGGDFSFHVQRLQTYLDCREIQGFERESAAWLATFEAPALDARHEVAKLEAVRLNWHGVLSVLEPAVGASTMKGEYRSLYIQALSHLRMYEALEAVFERYGSDIAPLKRAKYFFVPEAEQAFLRAIQPMLSGSESERIDGELAIAEYYLRVVEQEAKALEGVERVLAFTQRSSNGYERVVAFTNQFGLSEQAIAYAQKWLEDYPLEDKPYHVLGEIYLKRKNLSEAADVYTAYLGKQSDKYTALRHVYRTFSRYNAEESGLLWIEDVTASVLSEGMNADYLQALTESWLEAYRGMRSKDAEFAESLRLKIVDGYVRLLSVRPENAMSYAVSLGSIDAYEASSKAYDVAAKQGIKWSTDQHVSRVKMAVRAGRDGADIRAAVKAVDGDSKATFEMAAMLEAEQGIAYAVEILETQLGAKKSEDREKAYGYLTGWALSNGDFPRVRQYSAKVEESSVNHADIRLKCAKVAMSMNDWDEAVRHLTWLQATRPDSRGVLGTQLELARRAPAHVGAQKLFQTTLEGAEGVYHRLEWLSEFYEQYGDMPQALHYAQKAYDVLTIDNASLQLRLLGLYLHNGALDDERRAVVESLISSLKETPIWNANHLVQLSEQAQAAGYYAQAQTWMKEAISQSPDSRYLRQQKLEMALESESLGLTALSLEEASVPPAADVLGILESRGAMLDAFSAIDNYAQNGEYGIALSGLLRLLPAYVQGRGVVSTRRALEDYVEVASDYRSEVSTLLAKHALLGDSPCEALAWISDISDGAIWARTALRCTEAASFLNSALRSKRASMTYRARNVFDTEVYSAFVRHGASDMARQYAEDMGLELTAFEHFERMIDAGDVLEALLSLEQSPVAPSEVLDVMRILAGLGYRAEAVAYGQSRISELSEDDAVRAASLAVLLGASEAVFADYLPGNHAENYVDLEPEDVVKVVAVTHIESWLKTVPTYRLGSVIEVAMTCAAVNDEARPLILAAIEQTLSERDSVHSILIAYAQHALDAGLYDVAASVYARLVQSMPSSDYIHRMYSLALVRLGRVDEAWLELEEGARCASMVNAYWERCLELHRLSSVGLRLKINEAQRALAPRSALLYVDATRYALESSDVAQAQEWTRRAYAYGSYSVLSELAQVWESSSSLLDVPSEILASSTSMTLGIEARLAYQRGDIELASQRFAESASRAPWPLEVWSKNASYFENAGDMARLEQTIAQMMTAYPHAYEPYIHRAIFALEQGRLEDAWSDYQRARTLAFDAGDWHLPLVQAAAAKFDLGFVKRIYDQEWQTGTLKVEKWLDTLVSTYMDSGLASEHQISDAEWAQKGLEFMHQILPKAFIYTKDNSVLRARYVALEKRAHP